MGLAPVKVVDLLLQLGQLSRVLGGALRRGLGNLGGVLGLASQFHLAHHLTRGFLLGLPATPAKVSPKPAVAVADHQSDQYIRYSRREDAVEQGHIRTSG